MFTDIGIDDLWRRLCRVLSGVRVVMCVLALWLYGIVLLPIVCDEILDSYVDS